MASFGLDLPVLEFGSDASQTSLKEIIDGYNSRLAQAVSDQLEAWVTGSGGTEAWRDATIQPNDTLDEASGRMASLLLVLLTARVSCRTPAWSC